jgi:hypothetical protein
MPGDSPAARVHHELVKRMPLVNSLLLASERALAAADNRCARAHPRSDAFNLIRIESPSEPTTVEGRGPIPGP